METVKKNRSLLLESAGLRCTTQLIFEKKQELVCTNLETISIFEVEIETKICSINILLKW